MIKIFAANADNYVIVNDRETGEEKLFLLYGSTAHKVQFREPFKQVHPEPLTEKESQLAFDLTFANSPEKRTVQAESRKRQLETIGYKPVNAACERVFDCHGNPVVF